MVRMTAKFDYSFMGEVNTFVIQAMNSSKIRGTTGTKDEVTVNYEKDFIRVELTTSNFILVDKLQSLVSKHYGMVTSK